MMQPIKTSVFKHISRIIPNVGNLMASIRAVVFYISSTERQKQVVALVRIWIITVISEKEDLTFTD